MNWPRFWRITLTILSVLIPFLGILLLFAYLNLWIGGLAAIILLAVWLVVILAASIPALIFRKNIWIPDPEAKALRVLQKRVQIQQKQLSRRVYSIDRDILSVPINIFLSEKRDVQSTAMAELGYVTLGEKITHDGLFASTWTTQNAVAYRIEFDPNLDVSFVFLDLILRQAVNYRPTLPFNAVFVELELDQLTPQDKSSQVSDIVAMNRLLNALVERSGTDLPIHVALVGLEHIPDVARAAILTGRIGGDDIFGGFLNTSNGTGLPASIDNLFEKLIRQLDATQSEVLEKQLAPDFCASLVNAPFQMTLIQTQLRERINSLAQPLPPRIEQLKVQSLTFVGARREISPIDTLSHVVGQRFFRNSLVRLPVLYATEADTVTTRNSALMINQYHANSFAVAENKAEKIKSRARGLILSLILTAIALAFILVQVANFLVYRSVNDHVELAFDEYFDGTASLGTGSESLVVRVLHLSDIRDQLERYEPLDKLWYRKWLPNWSMVAFYRQAYEEELVGGYQTTLANYLERDLFAFNNLADGVELVSLASLEAQFATDQRPAKKQLIEYFTQGLIENGEVSNGFQSAFTDTLDDLFELNRPNADLRNETLVTVVARTLKGFDTPDILYRTLMRRPKFAEMKDVRQFVGPQFSQVYQPIEALKYLIPYAYTKPGFDALFEDGEIIDLPQLMAIYETVMGSLNAPEKNAAVRRVSELYTADYIRYWSTFLASLELRDAKGWAEAQILMSALTSPSENPISGLAQVLLTNTDLEVFLPVQQPVPVAPVAERADPTPAAEPQKPKLAPPSTSPEAAVAFNVRTAFRSFLDSARDGKDQRSELELFLEKSQAVTVWLEEASSAKGGPGMHLHTLYQAGETTNPLAELNRFSSNSELPLVRSFGSNLAQTLDDSAMGFVYDYIDLEWHREVHNKYGQLLSIAFPFDPESTVDLDLPDFVTIFGPQGAIDRFQKRLLGRLAASSGVFHPQPTFLLTGFAQLTPAAEEMFSVANTISETMFVDGKPLWNFRMRVGYMDRQLGEMSLSSGTTLHKFSHGPVIWSDQTWPVTGLKNGDLRLQVFKRSRSALTETYFGAWSWFHMSADSSFSVSPSLGLVEASFNAGGLQLILQTDSSTRVNPMTPGFFSDLVLPRSIFKAE